MAIQDPLDVSGLESINRKHLIASTVAMHDLHR
jgi:hypothetical protein